MLHHGRAGPRRHHGQIPAPRQDIVGGGDCHSTGHLIALSLTGIPVAAATATTAQAVTITTAKPFGPVPGTFEATGAFTDSGTFANTRFAFGALGAPTLVSIHVTQVFHGTQGSFTLRADIKVTLTQDPLVLVDSGTWAVIDGTGAYKTLRGRGTVTGTADEHSVVISRTYTGAVLSD